MERLMWSMEHTQGSADPKYMHTTGRYPLHNTYSVLALRTLLAAYTHMQTQPDTDTYIHTWSDDDL